MLEALLSPYAQVESAGINPASFANPLTSEILINNKLSFDITDPKGIDEVSVETFDLIITVSESAHNYLKGYDEAGNVEIEYWITAVPPVLGEVSREACLDAYQNIFDELTRHIQNRFEIIS